ncbi:MAG: SAM-dependent methyltransferase [Firmicutes bacterium HGW-Firmicutes-14]|nr:MAG: SAM-dependent methyltransferase [Firmicutes bacterium HGW-Firmicutes-14]
MEKGQISRMALYNAFVRGYHAAHDTPRIFDDFLAYQLLTKEERISIEESWLKNLDVEAFPDRERALAWLMQVIAGSPMTLSRARYVEDSLELAVRQGVRQYVILGAGMDTFAFRRPEMLEQLRVFEIDHPAMQAFKYKRIMELGWKIPGQLHFIPVDFTQDNLGEVLMGPSYDPRALTFFNWLGVTYYLPRNVVFSMLRNITGIAPAGSTVIFDYLDTDAFIPEKAAPRIRALVSSTRQVGEPMITGFDPLTLDAELEPLGLRLYEDLSPWDIQIRYFMGRTDHYHAAEHTHFANAVVE